MKDHLSNIKVHIFFVIIMATAGGSVVVGIATTHVVEMFVMLDIATHWFHARHDANEARRARRMEQENKVLTERLREAVKGR